MVRFMYYIENQHQINFECVPPADVPSVNNTPFNSSLPLEVQKQEAKDWRLQRKEIDCQRVQSFSYAR